MRAPRTHHHHHRAAPNKVRPLAARGSLGEEGGAHSPQVPAPVLLPATPLLSPLCAPKASSVRAEREQ